MMGTTTVDVAAQIRLDDDRCMAIATRQRPEAPGGCF